MRLLLLTTVYPTPRRPHKGTFNRELVAALRRAGNDVRVIAPVPWPDLLRSRTPLPPEGPVWYPTWWYPSRVAHVTYHKWMQRSVMPTVRRVTADWRPELVLGYWTHPDGTTALAAARKLGVPGVVMVGGSDVLLLTSEPGRRAVIVDTLTRADQVLTNGPVLRNKVVELGVPPTRVTAFHHGVDRSRFHPGDAREARLKLGLPLDRSIFVWVGHMVPVKGVDVLIDAWTRVAARAEPPLLVLIGDGAERPGLARRAAKLGATVRFLGGMSHDQLPAWYRAADAVLLPSRSEGVPNVLLESLACGTSFIASDVGGVAALRDETSTVIPAGDPDALAQAIIERLPQAPMSVRSHARVLDRAETSAEFQHLLEAVVHRAAPG